MKAKTIKKIIKAKVDDWLSSIEDETVRELASKNTVVTGGCIASMLLKEPVNDFDLYFTNKETTVAVAKYYVNRFHSKNKAGIEVPIYVDHDTDRVRIVVKSAGVASEEGTEKPYEYFEGRPDGEAGEYVSDVLGDAGDIEEALENTTDAALAVDDGKPKYRPVFLSTNAITLSHKVQIVLRFYGSADTIHENYDYVHCTNYWTSKDDELVLRQPALESLLARELRYVGSKYPICSVIRLRKFIKRGWTVNAGQILKMMLQISELNLKDHAVLQDQLTGVDAAYFVQLVSKVKENDPEKVNSAYLVEIIDRMF
ncbi:MAG: hypothetical protein QHC90_13375 [Shinella sp.]|nr:hypothetical protein [Shinella sp.]